MSKQQQRYYRAIVGMPHDAGAATKVNKDDLENMYAKPLEKVMKFWNSNKRVKPYPDLFTNPDALYREIYGDKVPKTAQEAAKDMENARDGLVFLPSKAPGHKRSDPREEPAPMTKLYAYSTLNPDGWYRDYTYPITHSYNGIDVKTSTLIHKGLGTPSNMLKVTDVDWDATYVPSVCLCHYVSDNEKLYDMLDRSPLDLDTDDEWGKECEKFFIDRIGRQGIVAMVECLL